MLGVILISFSQFGFDMFGAVPRTFNTQFRCYSVVMFPGNEREDVERGGKSTYLNTTGKYTYMCTAYVIL